MSRSICRVACLQLSTGETLSQNWSQLETAFHRALLSKPDLVILPEVCHYRVSSPGASITDEAEPLDGPFITRVQALAKCHQVAILVGSFIKLGAPKCFNTSVFIDEFGVILGVYHKMHLFDAVVEGQSLQESRYFDRGETPVLVNWHGLKIGLSICYDLRFPELYRYYANQAVDILAIPASFTTPTGLAHWKTLCCARAIENLSFVVAPNQVGLGAGGVDCYGHSLIIDPWGTILAEASPKQVDVIVADLDLLQLKHSRDKLPVLTHQHDFLKRV